MTITNRNLEPGTKLTGKYKGKSFICTVEAGEEGKVVFRLEGQDKTFNSVSSAANVVTKGPINGWAFWSREGEEATKPGKVTTKKAASNKGSSAAKARTRARTKAPHRIIRLHDNQEDLSEGESRWWCDGCMESFMAFEEPKQCPNGHQADDPELSGSAEGFIE